MLKINKKDTIATLLTSGVFLVHFEQLSYLFSSVFIVDLNKCLFAGINFDWNILQHWNVRVFK